MPLWAPSLLLPDGALLVSVKFGKGLLETFGALMQQYTRWGYIVRANLALEREHPDCSGIEKSLEDPQCINMPALLVSTECQLAPRTTLRCGLKDNF